MTTTALQIEGFKTSLGKNLTVMGHHYQNDAIMQHCDISGDSLELSRKVASVDSEHIVFCGVYFMGESAALLAREGQKVYLPELDANCVMAQMTPADLFEKTMQKLTANGRKLIPLAYVNSTLALKNIVGKYGGAVCTSSNAPKMLDWALKEGDGVIFAPDKNLAQNTANMLGLKQDEIHLLNIKQKCENIDLEAANKANLILWPGLCAIHAKFNVDLIQDARGEFPNCSVIVHPECSPEVVAASDESGSTAYIIDYVKNAQEGKTIIIGTEINLVRRLAKEYRGKINIIPLKVSSCSHMAAVTAPKLLTSLEEIHKGTATPIVIDKEVAENAKSTLERMFAVK